MILSFALSGWIAFVDWWTRVDVCSVLGGVVDVKVCC